MEETKQEPQETPSKASEGHVEEESGKEVPKEYAGGKYKNVEELEKGYQNLEKKVKEWEGKTQRLQELEEYQKFTVPVVNFVWRDRETLEKFRTQEVLGQQPPEGQSAPQATRDDPRIQEVIRSQKELQIQQEDKVIQDFERKHGLDKLSPEEAVQVREQIVEKMKTFSEGRYKPSLRGFEGWLENAYSLVTMDKLRESGKVEGLTEARGIQSATISQGPSETVTSEGLPILTKEQKETADKFSISHKDYAKQLKKIQEERG